MDALAAAKVDIVKIRIDDQLGAAATMAPEVYTAIIDEAHKKGMRVAVHIVKLADAKAVLRLGADLIAHSVRDAEIDDEVHRADEEDRRILHPDFPARGLHVRLWRQAGISEDPFLLKDVNQAELAKAQDPQFQESHAEQQERPSGIRSTCRVAMRNMKKLLTPACRSRWARTRGRRSASRATSSTWSSSTW